MVLPEQSVSDDTSTRPLVATAMIAAEATNLFRRQWGQTGYSLLRALTRRRQSSGIISSSRSSTVTMPRIAPAGSTTGAIVRS